MRLYLSNLVCLTSVICRRLSETCSCTRNQLVSKSRVSARDTRAGVKFELSCIVCILMETLHCTFSSNENTDAAASSFDSLFCGCSLDAPILATVWQHYWYPNHLKHLYTCGSIHGNSKIHTIAAKLHKVTDTHK